jgi:hypothetical protein
LQEGHGIQATLNYEPEHKRKTLCFTQYFQFIVDCPWIPRIII